MRFQMQTMMVRHHDLVKQNKGVERKSALSEAFWHKVKTARVVEHITFLFEEQNIKLSKAEKILLLEGAIDNAKKSLIRRGYQII